MSCNIMLFSIGDRVVLIDAQSEDGPPVGAVGTVCESLEYGTFGAAHSVKWDNWKGGWSLGHDGSNPGCWIVYASCIHLIRPD